MRAAAVTEGRQAGAPTADVAKQAGHADKRTTARVYDRDRLESARRWHKRGSPIATETVSEQGVS